MSLRRDVRLRHQAGVWLPGFGLHLSHPINQKITMPRTLYSPRLSDDVVRALYQEGKRRKQPMTRLADDLLRQALEGSQVEQTVVAFGKPERNPELPKDICAA